MRERAATIIGMCERGIEPSVVAERMQVSRSYVCKVLARYRPDLMPRKSPAAIAAARKRTRDIRRLLAGGLPETDVAASLRCSLSTVYRVKDGARASCADPQPELAA